jgi:hypothetical protein
LTDQEANTTGSNAVASGDFPISGDVQPANYPEDPEGGSFAQPDYSNQVSWGFRQTGPAVVIPSFVSAYDGRDFNETSIEAAPGAVQVSMDPAHGVTQDGGTSSIHEEQAITPQKAGFPWLLVGAGALVLWLLMKK